MGMWRVDGDTMGAVRHVGACVTTYRHMYTHSPATVELAPAHLEYAVQQLVLRHFHRDAGEILGIVFARWLSACRYARARWRCRIAAVSRRVHRLAGRVLGAMQSYTAHRQQTKQTAIQALLHAAAVVQRMGLHSWVEWCNCRTGKTMAMQQALRHRASCLVRFAQVLTCILGCTISRRM